MDVRHGEELGHELQPRGDPPRDGARVTEAELHAYCRERIAAYKYPRRFEFRAQLPKNSLGKVLKDELIPR
ncbi:MAG: AMP-binding enzyme [Streptosporangiaceae bacterium]